MKIPRRSVLSVPGHISKMHFKAASSSADIIMLDLEDSVPVDLKEKARGQVLESLKSIAWKEKTLSLRINPVVSPFAFRDIIEIIGQVPDIIKSIVVPKVNSASDIHFVAKLLDGIELETGSSNKTGIEASIETAEGLEKIDEIADATDRLVTLVFGIADYSSSLGIRLSSISGHGENEEEIYSGHRWHYVLSRMANAAKARGLDVIDAPYGNYSDNKGLKNSALLSLALGYDGKWAIHPGQIDTINQVYTPSGEEIQNALRIINAHEQAIKSGKGAVSLEGRMIDHATIRMAKDLYNKAFLLKLI